MDEGRRDYHDMKHASKKQRKPSSVKRSRKAAAGAGLTFDDYFGNSRWVSTGSGVYVTEDTALRMVTVMSCVRAIAETVGNLPLVLYRENGRIREPAKDDSLYEILYKRPNDWQTATDFWQMMTAHAVLRGNGYAQIVAGRRGAVEQLRPLHPDRMTVKRLENGRLRYEYRMPDSAVVTNYTQDEIFHLRGLSLDGIVGVSPITLHAETIGGSHATEMFGSNYFGNACVPSFAIEYDKPLKTEQIRVLKESIRGEHGGPSNAHKVMILEAGMKLSQMKVSAQDAQLIEARKLNDAQICSIFRVPPHLAGVQDKSTYNGLEQQNLSAITYTFMPWCRRIEQAIGRDLITDDTLYAKFNMNALLRGDSQARQAFYASALQNGYKSINEVRALEDDNPIEGGDEYRVQLNMVNTGPSQTVGTEPEDTEDDEAGDDAGDASAAAGQGARAVWPSPSLPPIIHDAAERMAHAELNGLGKRIEKSAENLVRFRAWTREFYGGHIRTVTRIMAPICRAVGADAENVPVFAERLAESAIDQFAQENPRLVYEQWRTTRAGDLVRLIESHIYGDATNGNQPRQSTDGPADSGDHAGSGSDAGGNDGAATIG